MHAYSEYGYSPSTIRPSIVVIATATPPQRSTGAAPPRAGVRSLVATLRLEDPQTETALVIKLKAPLAAAGVGRVQEPENPLGVAERSLGHTPDATWGVPGNRGSS